MKTFVLAAFILCGCAHDITIGTRQRVAVDSVYRLDSTNTVLVRGDTLYIHSTHTGAAVKYTRRRRYTATEIMMIVAALAIGFIVRSL